MKRALNGLGAALCAGALLATVGCDSIRTYSVRTYQGVMPVNDFRPTGAATVARTDIPNPSVPTPPPEAAPAASASPTTTKPADSSK